MKKMNKKIIAFIITIITIVILSINVICVNMTPEEFFNQYDYEYQYKVVCDDGSVHYFSSETPITFSLTIVYYDTIVDSGKSLKVSASGTIHMLKNSGTYYEIDKKLYMIKVKEGIVYHGYEYVEIYERVGDSFFLPKDSKGMSQILETMKNLIPPMVGLTVFAISLKKGWQFLNRHLVKY